MNTLRSAASVLAFAFLLGLGGQLYAEEKGDAELARDLTVQGIAAQQRGDHAAALAYFERAQRELDHAKIRYFRAKSLDALARYQDALALFRSIDDDADNAKYAGETKAYIRAIVAEQESARLLAKLSEVQKACSQAGAEPVPVAPHPKE